MLQIYWVCAKSYFNFCKLNTEPADLKSRLYFMKSTWLGWMICWINNLSDVALNLSNDILCQHISWLAQDFSETKDSLLASNSLLTCSNCSLWHTLRLTRRHYCYFLILKFLSIIKVNWFKTAWILFYKQEN